MTNYIYGTEVIEFYPHDSDELNEYIQRAEDHYYNSTITLVENGLAANVMFREGPLSVALPKFMVMINDGYGLRQDRFVGMQGGALDVTLLKPQHLIDIDLVKVHSKAAEAYDADRYNRNAVETEYQVGITLARKEREQAAAQAAAIEQAEKEARESAMNDLRVAYS